MTNTHLKEFITRNFNNCDDKTVEDFHTQLQKILTLDPSIVTDEEEDNWNEEAYWKLRYDIEDLIWSVDKLPKWFLRLCGGDLCDSIVEDLRFDMFKAYFKDGNVPGMTETQIQGLDSIIKEA
jgi:hypothetical protein